MSATSLRPVCEQDSVMEFGFNGAKTTSILKHDNTHTETHTDRQADILLIYLLLYASFTLIQAVKPTDIL